MLSAIIVKIMDIFLEIVKVKEKKEIITEMEKEM